MQSKIRKLYSKKTTINDYCLTVSEFALRDGNLKDKGILKSVWEHLKDYEGVFIVIKTNFN